MLVWQLLVGRFALTADAEGPGYACRTKGPTPLAPPPVS
jgi:hypothetical protein